MFLLDQIQDQSCSSAKFPEQSGGRTTGRLSAPLHNGSRIRAALNWAWNVRRRWKARCELLALDDDQLRDAGISNDDVRRAAARSIWSA